MALDQDNRPYWQRPLRGARRAGLRTAAVLSACVLAACTPEPDLPSKAVEADPGSKATAEVQVVRALMGAFNDHDVSAMSQHLAPDIEWLFVDGSQIVIEVSGREAMAASMEDYFEAFPTVSSQLLAIESLGRFVTTHERALWTTDGEERSQASAAVYEIQAGVVNRVWYFPAVQQESVP